MSIVDITYEGGKPRILNLDEKGQPNHLRLLKLRNPWSKYEWLGPWGDQTSQWTPELRQLLRHETKEDGVFYISYPDFINNFVNFVVCRVKDAHKFSGNKFTTSSTHPTCLQFTIKSPGKYAFSLSQVSKRFFRDSDKYVYSACSLMIARISSKGEIQEFGCGHDQHQHIHVDSECPAGNYVAFIFTPWRRKVN